MAWFIGQSNSCSRHGSGCDAASRHRRRRGHFTSDDRARTRLPTHPVKGIAKAMLSRLANVKAGRYEGATFARFFIDDALRQEGNCLPLKAADAS